MKHILLLLAAIFCVAISPLSAQLAASPFEVGVYSAYQFTHFSGGKIEIRNVNYEDGTYSSTGFTVGMTAEYHLNPTFALLGIVRYEELHGTKTKIGDKYPSKLADGTEILTEIHDVLEIHAPQIATTILGKITIPDTRFSILAGASIGILVNDKEEQRYELITDPSKPVQFPISPDSLGWPVIDTLPGVKGQFGRMNDNRTSITQYSGTIYERKALQFGLTGGLQYDIPLMSEGTALTLTPSVLFGYNLTTYSDYENLRAWTVSAGLMLKIGL